MPPGSLHHITLRIEHDCPLANLSREHPRLTFDAWSGHHVEVVAVPTPEAERSAVEASMRQWLRPFHLVAAGDGVMAAWRPEGAPDSSLTREMERFGLVWSQPLKVRAGWEHYDLLAFSEEAEREALAELRVRHAVQVVRRSRMDPDEALATLFMSVHPAVRAPTDKQAEALVAAFERGYYRSPRGVTTAGLAAGLGVGRSAFEERLRSGENRVMAAVLPAMRRLRSK